jgi:hypothetical protein
MMSKQRNSDTSNRSSRPAQKLDLAVSLEILNGLLNTLRDVVDVREVFERASGYTRPNMASLRDTIFGFERYRELMAPTGLRPSTARCARVARF